MDPEHNAPALLPLSELESAEGRKLMDLVNELRHAGLNGVLHLPQLVVCGDQSSGKSSVLEAISGIPFPRKENLCTRFATEVIMRTGPTTSLVASIIPDGSRPAEEQEELQGFSETFYDLDKLADLYDRAKKAMGLDSPLSVTKAFTADVLSIELCGPSLPQLTLVDLPGLIHAENKLQSAADVTLIRDLVETYMSNTRTVILAVISAKNDYANQIVLKHCRRADPNGSRTLGIITKPDCLRAGSDNERAWLDLALNYDVQLQQGWHLLRNRTDEETHFTVEERDRAEHDLFSKGRYRDIPADMKGITTLRVRLTVLMLNHLKRELPHLMEDLEEKLATTGKSLEGLGTARATVSEQRQHLTALSMEAHDILRSAVEGSYDLRFFTPLAPEKALDAVPNTRRLRAVVQHYNLRFAARLRSHGHKYEIGGRAEQNEAMDAINGTASADDQDEATRNEKDRQAPRKMSRAKAIEWVVDTLQRSRGQELPGTFNPLLIGQLFWQQSEPWETLAQAHIHEVAQVCQTFVQIMLGEIAPPDVATRLSRTLVQSAHETALKDSLQELTKIAADRRRQPMTYNHYFTTTLQKLRQERYGRDVARVLDSARVGVDVKNYNPGAGYSRKEFIDPAHLELSLKSNIEQDMDKLSAAELLDCLAAYYKDELKYFIGVVTKQVVERHLVGPLPSLVSPLVVAKLSDDEVERVVAEPKSTISLRKTLEERKAMLDDGKRVLTQALLVTE